MFSNFDFCAKVERVRCCTRYLISLDFPEEQRPCNILDCQALGFEIQLCSSLECSLQDQTFLLKLLGICKVGFGDNFSGCPIDNWLSVSCWWNVENLEISLHAQGRRLSLLQTQGNVWNCVRFINKHFMFVEELNTLCWKIALSLL